MDLNPDFGEESSDSATPIDRAATHGPSDLTPRVAATRRKRRWSAPAMLSVVVAAGGFVAFKGLNNATQYFCNADEVGTRRGCNKDDRFRLQGVVKTGSVSVQGAVTTFVVEYNKVEISARHEGDPPELFQEGIPVVLEGSLVAGQFESNKIMVKHSEVYKAENPDRIPAGGL
jgi:cytochrome c-type biogenesis protein CcmE